MDVTTLPYKLLNTTALQMSWLMMDATHTTLGLGFWLWFGAALAFLQPAVDLSKV